MPAGRKRQRPLPDITPRQTETKVELSKSETDELNAAYTELTSAQLTAARLESSGIRDRSIIASQVGVDPQIISAWRRKSSYKKIIDINIKLIDKVSRETRESSAKMIISMCYANIINKISDSEYLNGMDIRDSLELITKLTKEIRLDLMVNADSTPKEDELAELQRRRNELPSETKPDLGKNIIQYPSRQINE